jgi:thioesterase domain-containing protein
MQLNELEKYLQTQIPLVESLGARIVQANDNLVEVHAPLAPNRNHLGTVFGGSTYCISVLACYTWLYNLLLNKKLTGHVVIKSGQMKYMRPVDGDFTSVCFSPSNDEIEKFLRILDRKKKSQMSLKSEIKMKSEVVCIFEGEFVALL